MHPVLNTPGRGRGVAVKVDCDLDRQALSLLHICDAEAGGVQPRSKVVELPLVWEILASSLAVRRGLEGRPRLWTTGTYSVALLHTLHTLFWPVHWPGMPYKAPLGAVAGHSNVVVSTQRSARWWQAPSFCSIGRRTGSSCACDRWTILVVSRPP